MRLALHGAVILASAALFCSCATAPRTYQPPDAAKLIKSTARVARAVDAAHASARAAQAHLSEARARQKEIREAVSKLKDAPPELLEKMNAQDITLEQVAQDQGAVETHLVEADKAKAQVETDKTEYFGAAKKLADAATDERTKRIKDEKALSWYRWHWWGSWIALGLGVLACLLFAFLKFSGRLAMKL